MPCLEISMPKTDIRTKKRLAEKLTTSFATVSNFDAEIFGIRFLEYENNSASSGGKLCDGSENSPYLHFVLYCPKITRTTKKKLAESLTSAFIEAVENISWKPVIHICEHPYDNVVVDGQLLSDAFEECAERKFYYDLPKD